jgi:uncharacterized membrane protein YhaH (DUF805 family)
MNTTNPYTPPRANVADIDTDTFQPVRIWSVSGRIGRLRYWTYSTVATIVFGLVVAIVVALLGPAVGPSLAMLAYIPLLIFFVFLMIQRAHDMDWSGWMSLLAFIPLVGLIWLFKSGTTGENRFGAPPPPNSLIVKILGFALPIAYLLMIFAIAIPAYQGYVERARAAQHAE